MDETHSELTKISILTKRPRGQVDGSIQITARTLDKSFTEISDITELSLAKVYSANLIQENLNNDALKAVEDIQSISLSEEKENINGIQLIVLSDEMDSIESKNEKDNKHSLYESKDTADDDKLQISDDVRINVKTEGYSRFDTEYASQNLTMDILNVINKKEEQEITDIPETYTMVNKLSLSTKDTVSLDKSDEEEVDHISNRSIILPFSEEEIEKEEEIPIKESEETIQLKQKLMLEERYKLIEKLNNAINDKTELMLTNQNLEKRIFKYFKRKRPDASSKMKKQLQEKESSIIDKQERYEKCMITIMNMQKELNIATSEMDKINEDKLDLITLKDRIILETNKEFLKIQQGIGNTAMNSNTGKRIPSQNLETYYALENTKDDMVHTVRLENLKLQNEVKRLSLNLFAKETLTDKLNLVDFEQLKIENYTYKGKLEERNDTIRRLNGRINDDCHKISHTREKIQQVRNETCSEDKKQKEVTKYFDGSRKVLTKAKRERDQMLTVNQKLVNSGGLLRNKKLLDHFQYTVDDMQVRRDRLVKMERECKSILVKEGEIKQKLKYMNKMLS